MAASIIAPVSLEKDPHVLPIGVSSLLMPDPEEKGRCVCFLFFNRQTSGCETSLHLTAPNTRLVGG